MRILVCTKRDLHGVHFLNRLLPALGAHRVAGVWLSDKVRDAEHTEPELAQLRFLERSLPVDHLFPLVDALSQSFAHQAPEATFSGLARRHRVAISVVDEVNGETARLRMSALAPDLVIAARFSLLFDPATLAIPRHGFVNVHPGRLPEFAGLHAPLRTILDGEDTLGCSVHWITPGIDDGPLVAVHSRPLDRHQGLLTQVSELYPLAIPTLCTLVSDIAAGRRPAGQPQERARRRYRSLPAPSEFAALARAGIALWTPTDYAQRLGRFLPPGLSLPAGLAANPPEARVPSL